MRSIFLLCVVLTSAFFIAACGPGASSNSGAPSPTTVTVTMTEFKIEPSMTNFKVGVPYRFVVSNKGTVNHDFSISPPVMAGMTGMSADGSHESALAVIDAQDMPPGATKTIDVTFSKPYSSSDIEIACHTPGHYDSGMKVPVTVTQ